jgi:putative Ig domain-containing protein
VLEAPVKINLIAPGQRSRASFLAAAAVAVLATTLQHPAPATAAPPPAGVTARMFGPADPYYPAYHHGYRLGVLPSLPELAKMRAWAKAHQNAPATTGDVHYEGGYGGIGVDTGHEKVYLVFYGSQWGTQGTDANGNVTLSGDPSGEAPYLQRLFKGLGTGGETWSGVLTQYCQDVPVGSTSCPATNTERVAYPKGGALAGVWVDESAPSPAAATVDQLAQEAVNAAAHFGNTTRASNRDAQYDILSPTGTDPDDYQGSGYCAWHDFVGDSFFTTITSPYGYLPFTNMPYLTDAPGCFQNAVNAGSAGLLDGLSIANGHEYAETISDPTINSWLTPDGMELADLCVPDYQGFGDVTMSTGSFAMQPLWANDGPGGGACELSHPIWTTRVSLRGPGTQRSDTSTYVQLRIKATDSVAALPLTFTAAGLPAGLSIDAATGVITGIAPPPGTFKVRVRAVDGNGASASASFTWSFVASHPLGWHALALSDKWRPAPAADHTAAPSYAVSGGIVYLSGAAVQSGGGSAGLTVLPPGARPAHALTILVSVAKGAPGYLSIASDGAVQAHGTPQAKARALTSLAGVSFPSARTSLHALTLTHGWQPLPPSAHTGAPSFSVTGGVVRLSGWLRRQSFSTSEFAQLPVTARPGQVLRIAIVAAGGVSGDLVIDPDGAMYASLGRASATSLDGVAFPARQVPAIPLALVNGWTAGPAAFGSPSFAVSGGFIYLTGSLAGSAATSGVFAVLPPGARPHHDMYIRTVTSTGQPGTVLIEPDGQALAYSTSSADATAFTSLATVAYPAGG